MTDVTETIARAIFVREFGEPEDFGKWQILMDLYRAHAVAIQEHLSTAGFTIVPTQPTEAMIDEGYESYQANGGSLLDVYRDMVSRFTNKT